MYKEDQQEIRTILAELRTAKWLGPSRQQWPLYAYHMSDVNNVAGILQSGRLLSRRRCADAGLLRVDSAHRNVIANSAWAHDYVRLYFRPRTPTQFHMEGIRPRVERTGEANCPVPVFLLFKAEELFCREGVRFTNMNFAASGCSTGESAEFLRNLVFPDIYSDGGMRQDDRERLKRARCAEILYPGEIGLDLLEAVVCRSAPERATLLYLLGEHAERWERKVRVQHHFERLFEANHVYVQEVLWAEGSLAVRLNRAPGRYEVDLEVLDQRGRRLTRAAQWLEPLPSRLRVPIPSGVNRIDVRCEIERDLAYQGVMESNSLYTA